MDAKHLSIGQWCVAAARHAGPDWAQVLRQRCRTGGSARRARPAAYNLNFNFAHGFDSLAQTSRMLRFARLQQAKRLVVSTYLTSDPVVPTMGRLESRCSARRC